VGRRGGGTRAPRARIERSAGGVIYRRIDGTPRVLLIRDAYEHWGLPKGHIEPGETADAAALREVEEETGLANLVLGPGLLTIDWFFRARGRTIHKYCHFFLIESPDGETMPQADEGITECCWVSVTEAFARLSHDNAREVLRLAAVELKVPVTMSTSPVIPSAARDLQVSRDESSVPPRSVRQDHS
jgi:8-oxo-dGTP pyrophosphatase MutT (NUDIX family)